MVFSYLLWYSIRVKRCVILSCFYITVESTFITDVTESELNLSSAHSLSFCKSTETLTHTPQPERDYCLDNVIILKDTDVTNYFLSPKSSEVSHNDDVIVEKESSQTSELDLAEEERDPELYSTPDSESLHESSGQRFRMNRRSATFILLRAKQEYQYQYILISGCDRSGQCNQNMIRDVKNSQKICSRPCTELGFVEIKSYY